MTTVCHVQKVINNINTNYSFKRTLYNYDKLDSCMPVKTVTIRSKDAVWINADIRWAIKQRYRLFKKAKRSNKDEDWRAYRTYRNLVTAKIRDRKLEYLNELDLKASDPKQFGTKEWWKLVKQFMNKKKAYPTTFLPSSSMVLCILPAETRPTY